MPKSINNRGFANMDIDRQIEIASKGGKASSGKFKNDHDRAREAGKKGAERQSLEAKRKGGEHSHHNK